MTRSAKIPLSVLDSCFGTDTILAPASTTGTREKSVAWVCKDVLRNERGDAGDA